MVRARIIGGAVVSAPKISERSRAVRISYGGETWYADDAGRIERPGLVSGSDSWRIVGAVERNNFGHVVRRYSLADVLSGKVAAWRNKNGTQRVFLCDCDHGTYREMGSPRVEVQPC
jgi:hypothetical protein